LMALLARLLGTPPPSHSQKREEETGSEKATEEEREGERREGEREEGRV
jgi:hypothetical protein